MDKHLKTLLADIDKCKNKIQELVDQVAHLKERKKEVLIYFSFSFSFWYCILCSFFTDSYLGFISNSHTTEKPSPKTARISGWLIKLHGRVLMLQQYCQ